MVKQVLHSLLFCFIKKRQSQLNTKITFIFALILLCFSSIVKADVVASVDKKSLELGDNIQLTIYAGNISNNAVPDLSDVVDDFDLLGSSQTQQVTMSNNRMESQTVWIFTLSPKRIGKLTIPAISLGSQQTVPITVQVKDTIDDTNNSPTASGSTRSSSTPTAITSDKSPPVTQDVFLKADLSPSSPYVQSQAIYTLRLFYDKQIADPQISEPTADNANFIRIGQNDEYQKIINNHPYQVIEMKYAFFPEKSGVINIKGPTFMGNMLTGGMVTFTNANFKSIHTSANSITATIKPIPATAANSWWLPATDVKISEQWASELQNAQVGVPITRTVKLAAQGIMAAQLPVMISNNIPGFQIYPDKPVLTSNSDGENVFGTRVETAAYIPTQAGAVTLPSIIVNWWDTKNNQMKTATLPAKTINVLPAAGSSSQVITPMSASANAKKPDSMITNLTAKKEVVISKAKMVNYWFWIAISLGIVWLITIFSWFMHWRKQAKKNILKDDNKLNDTQTPETIRQARMHVEQAVKAQNPQQFAVALINLAQQTWPEILILSLADIASQCKSSQAKDILLSLDKIRYSSNSDAWQADLAWKILMKEIIPGKINNKKDDGQLPTLYPKGLDARDL